MAQQIWIIHEAGRCSSKSNVHSALTGLLISCCLASQWPALVHKISLPPLKQWRRHSLPDQSISLVAASPAIHTTRFHLQSWAELFWWNLWQLAATARKIVQAKKTIHSRRCQSAVVWHNQVVNAQHCQSAQQHYMRHQMLTSMHFPGFQHTAKQNSGTIWAVPIAAIACSQCISCTNKKDMSGMPHVQYLRLLWAQLLPSNIVATLHAHSDCWQLLFRLVCMYL